MSRPSSAIGSKSEDKPHSHSEEIEKSRPASGLRRPSSGPLRTGRGSTSNEIVAQSSVSDQDPIQSVGQKNPLPPIKPEDADNGKISPESDVDPETDDENEGTYEHPYRPGRKMHPVVLKGYRSEPFVDRSLEEPSINKAEEVRLFDAEGNERILTSRDCQTDWTWVEEMRRYKSEKVKQADEEQDQDGIDVEGSDNDEGEIIKEEEINVAESPNLEDLAKFEALAQEKDAEAKEILLSKISLTMSPDSVKSPSPCSPKLPKKSATGSKTKSKAKASTSKVSKKPPGKKKPAGSAAASLRDDDYGIPMLQLSTDSDYNRESEKKEIKLADMDGLDPDIISKLVSALEGGSQLHASSSQGGMFQGNCEFCGEAIKKFPTMEEQKVMPPEQLYCCDEYRQFVQFMVSHPLHDKFDMDRLIDISPHPPFGSKQARTAAKERAAQSEMHDAEALALRVQAKLKNRTTRKRFGREPLARQMKTINYSLASQKCLEEGWTVRAPSPLNEDQDVEVFEPQPVLPPWADPQKYYQLYHTGCFHKFKPHFHNIFYQPDWTIPTLRDRGLVRKLYPDGKTFVILFPDGTGNVFYPSGRVAISILTMERSGGLYSYLVSEDKEGQGQVLALFQQNGCGTTYYPNGAIRVCLDQYGGLELDAHGAKKRKWSWKDQVQHVHAPPIQPITLAVNPQCAVRMMSQENVSLTFTAYQRSVRFQVGTRLKVVAPHNYQEPEIDDDQLFRDEVRNRIQELLLKVNNLLKFPKSPKLDKLPNPPHLTSRQLKTEKLRTIRRERTMAKDKKTETPVVIVN